MPDHHEGKNSQTNQGQYSGRHKRNTGKIHRRFCGGKPAEQLREHHGADDRRDRVQAAHGTL